MRFQPGQTAMRRYALTDGRIGLVHCGRVVSDDERGLLTWVSGGSAVADRVTLDGQPVRKMPVEAKLRTPTILAPNRWRGQGVLQLTPPDSPYSVWWFFADDMTFRGWYVNLETPGHRWFGGVDTFDLALDVWVEPDGTWRWKDEDEFAERTGHPRFWDADEALHIRAAGECAAKLAESGVFPFDGTWCDFVPDTGWEATTLPWWWDQVPDRCAVRPPALRRAG